MKKLLLLSILLSSQAYSQEFEFNIPMLNKPHDVIKFSAESGKTYNWDRCYGQTTQLLSEDGVSCEKVINSRSGFTGSVDVCVTATKDYLSDPYCFAMCGSESVTWGNCTASVSLSEHLEIKNITNTDNRYVGTAEMLCTDGVWSIKSSNCEDNLASCGTDHNTVNNTPSNLCEIGSASSVTANANANTMNWNCATSANTVACLSYKVALCDNTTFNGCSVGTSTGYTSVVTDTTATWNCTNSTSTANCSKAKTTVSGVCGSSNGQTLGSQPSTNLCTTGTASVVANGTNEYTWSCSGSENTDTTSVGATVNCSATKLAVCDTTTFGSCTLGTASAYTSAIGDSTATWNCVNGISSTTCSKVKLAAVNGSCGSVNGTMVATKPSTNLCNTGTPSTVITNTTNHTWTCQGSVASHNQIGGTTSNCSANREPICNTGFSWNGTTCQKYEQKSAYSNYNISCPSGQIVMDGTCYITKPIASSSPWCPSDDGYSWGIDYNYTSNPYRCIRRGDSGTRNYYYYCDSGWSLSGTTCSKTTNQSPIGYK